MTVKTIDLMEYENLPLIYSNVKFGKAYSIYENPEGGFIEIGFWQKECRGHIFYLNSEQIISRENEPAVICFTRQSYDNGFFQYAVESERYVIDGRIHRLNGPAIIQYYNNKEKYVIDGHYYDNYNEFMIEINNVINNTLPIPIVDMDEYNLKFYKLIADEFNPKLASELDSAIIMLEIIKGI